jgi:hypothetical protein
MGYLDTAKRPRLAGGDFLLTVEANVAVLAASAATPEPLDDEND